MMRAEIEGVPYHTIHHRGGIPAGEGMEGRIETAAAARGGAGGGHGVLPPPSRTNEHVHNRRGISLATVVPPARGTTTSSSLSTGRREEEETRTEIEGVPYIPPGSSSRNRALEGPGAARRPVLDIAGAGRKVGECPAAPRLYPRSTSVRGAGRVLRAVTLAVRRDDVPRLPAPCRSVDDRMGVVPALASRYTS